MNDEKLRLTRYILHAFANWYSAEKTIESNDLSVLKTLKLFFLLSTINSDSDENLESLGFDRYHALPLGPVEMDVYRFFKNELSMAITKQKLSVEQIGNEEISYEKQQLIDNLIIQLKEKNNRLILASASYLVELTHKYASWIISFNNAKLENRNSEIMDMEYFRTEEKFYYL